MAYKSLHQNLHNQYIEAGTLAIGTICRVCVLSHLISAFCCPAFSDKNFVPLSLNKNLIVFATTLKVIEMDISDRIYAMAVLCTDISQIFILQTFLFSWRLQLPNFGKMAACSVSVTQAVP